MRNGPHGPNRLQEQCNFSGTYYLPKLKLQLLKIITLSKQSKLLGNRNKPIY